MITGTPAFYDGPSRVGWLPPLAQRLTTDFNTDARFDNPRAVRVRVRDPYAGGASDRERVLVTVLDITRSGDGPRPDQPFYRGP